MMVKWRRFWVIIVASGLIALGVGLARHMHYTQSILTVATAPDYCPYEFIDRESGRARIVGFDMDLTQAIAEAMGYRLDINAMPFNQVFLTLRSQEADFAVAAITPTAEREAIVSFSSIYYEAQSVLVSRRGWGISSLDDASGQRIGAKPGTVHERLAQEITNDVVSIDHANTALQALKTRQIDGAIIDRAIADLYLSSMSGLETVAIANTQPAGAAIAFPKRSRLVGRVNQILAKLKQDGTITRLIQTWFDDYVCPSSEEPQTLID